MNRGLVISGVGHLGLILWVLLGDWLFVPSDAPPVQVAQVSLVSSAEFDAMMSEAPAAPSEAPAQPETPATPPPEAAPAPAAEPAADLPQDVPEADVAQPDPVPDTPAPPAAEAQPIPVPNSDVAPAPRPIDRVAAEPVDPTRDAPVVADQATPEQTDLPSPDVQPVPVQPDAAPEAAAPTVVTEATPTATDAPQLAPTTSKRPQTRPKKPVAAAVDTAAADSTNQDAVAAALAEALAEPAPAAEAPPADTAAQDNTQTSDTGGSGEAPTGPPMTAGETDALRVAVSKCWSLGAISTEAMQTIVTLQVTVAEDGKPDSGSIQMTDFTGGSEAAAKQMYDVARRAIIRCGKSGFPLPPEKYETWKTLELVFDPNGMRLR